MSHWATAVFRVSIALIGVCIILILTSIFGELRRTNQLLQAICVANSSIKVTNKDNVQVITSVVCP